MTCSNGIVILLGVCSGATAHLALPQGAFSLHGLAFHDVGIAEDDDEIGRSTHSQKVQCTAFQYVLGVAGYGPLGRCLFGV